MKQLVDENDALFEIIYTVLASFVKPPHLTLK
jgi:hypothetical protein